MQKISVELQKKIQTLRKQGKSIPEISLLTGTAKTTVQRYVCTTVVPQAFNKSLKEKQGGSKSRAQALRVNIYEEASTLLSGLSERDYLMLFTGLYWGEGTKRDFGIINSDPYLIQTAIKCLLSIGIDSSRFSISLRIHTDINIEEAKKFWSNMTRMPLNSITHIEVIEGKKKGKLKYGMCRIRIRKGIKDRLLIQSLISLIGKDSYNKLLSS